MIAILLLNVFFCRFVDRLLEGLLGRAERAREDADTRARLAEDRLRYAESAALANRRNRPGSTSAGAARVGAHGQREWYEQSPGGVGAMEDDNTEDELEVMSGGRPYTLSVGVRGRGSLWGGGSGTGEGTVQPRNEVKEEEVGVDRLLERICEGNEDG